MTGGRDNPGGGVVRLFVLEKPIRWLADAGQETGMARRRWLLWAVLAGSLALGTVTIVVGGSVVPLELARTTAGFRDALETLEKTGHSVAAVRWGTLLDFGFIITYVLAAGGLALRAGDRGGTEGWARAGTWFMRVTIVAGLLDVVENVLLLVLLQGRGASWLAGIKASAAVFKFVLLLGGTIPFVVVAWIRSGMVATANRSSAGD
ncbi:MAG: hypothetical protein WBV06_04530 [Acidimicrobiia bacterium]